jgi:hypothetical protein
MTDTGTFRTKRGLDAATASELADLFHELSHDPETRKIIATAVKKKKAGSAHAEAFKDVDLEERIESFEQKQERKDLERQQQEVVARMNAQRQRLLEGGDTGRKYSEDDVKKIETLMQKKGITDYDDGAVLYSATLPPEDPQPGKDIPAQHGATWEFPEWGKFGKDPVKASRDTAHQVITEFMRAKR